MVDDTRLAAGGPADAHGPDHVVDAGDHGDHHAPPPSATARPRPAAGERPDVPGDRHDLQHRLDLAARGWPGSRRSRITQNRSSGHPDLADQDHDGDPPRQRVVHGEQHQRGTGQRLVRDRVGHLAERGDLVEACGRSSRRRSRSARRPRRRARPRSGRPGSVISEATMSTTKTGTRHDPQHGQRVGHVDAAACAAVRRVGDGPRRRR